MPGLCAVASFTAPIWWAHCDLWLPPRSQRRWPTASCHGHTSSAGPAASQNSIMVVGVLVVSNLREFTIYWRRKYTNGKTTNLIFAFLKCCITEAFPDQHTALAHWVWGGSSCLPRAQATGGCNKKPPKCLSALYECHALAILNYVTVHRPFCWS